MKLDANSKFVNFDGTGFGLSLHFVQGEGAVMSCNITKSGLPCMFESGGSWTKTGEVRLIGDDKGNKKMPVYIRYTGDLACKDHALFPININDTILSLSKDSSGIYFTVHRVNGISVENRKVYLIGVPITDVNIHMLEAAYEKVNTYHCRKAVYYLDNPRLSYIKQSEIYKEDENIDSKDDKHEV